MKIDNLGGGHLEAFREVARNGTDEELAKFLMGSAFGIIIGSSSGASKVRARRPSRRRSLGPSRDWGSQRGFTTRWR